MSDIGPANTKPILQRLLDLGLPPEMYSKRLHHAQHPPSAMFGYDANVNRYRAGDTAAALGEYPQLTLFDTPIRRRNALANAAAYGLAVSEVSPKDSKSCDEVLSMLHIVFPYTGA